MARALLPKRGVRSASLASLMILLGACNTGTLGDGKTYQDQSPGTVTLRLELPAARTLQGAPVRDAGRARPERRRTVDVHRDRPGRMRRRTIRSPGPEPDRRAAAGAGGRLIAMRLQTLALAAIILLACSSARLGEG